MSQNSQELTSVCFYHVCERLNCLLRCNLRYPKFCIIRPLSDTVPLCSGSSYHAPDAFTLAMMVVCFAADQGRSQKFVLGGIKKVFWGYKTVE